MATKKKEIWLGDGDQDERNMTRVKTKKKEILLEWPSRAGDTFRLHSKASTHNYKHEFNDNKNNNK